MQRIKQFNQCFGFTAGVAVLCHSASQGGSNHKFNKAAPFNCHDMTVYLFVLVSTYFYLFIFICFAVFPQCTDLPDRQSVCANCPKRNS